MVESKQIAQIIIEAFKTGHKLLVCGNGGSAAQAQHLTSELVGRFKYKRKALPAISLTTDTSILTAWANDYSFDQIFSRQIEALGQDGDVLLLISTSGQSKNILQAQKTGERMGLIIVDLPKEGKDTPEIQENQLKFIHEVCRKVEEAFL